MPFQSESDCRSDASLAYALMRITFGVNLFMRGITWANDRNDEGPVAGRPVNGICVISLPDRRGGSASHSTAPTVQPRR